MNWTKMLVEIGLALSFKLYRTPYLLDIPYQQAALETWNFELTQWRFCSVWLRSRDPVLSWRFHVHSNVVTPSKMFHEANLLWCKHNLKYFATTFLMLHQGFIKYDLPFYSQVSIKRAARLTTYVCS